MTATYESARAIFANWNVDAEAALARLAQVAISIHSWQGDDVRGFEGLTAASGGGIQATGNFPGRARNPCGIACGFGFCALADTGPSSFKLTCVLHGYGRHARSR